MPRKIIIAITGASGSIYAKKILEKINHTENKPDVCDIVFSKNASEIWLSEIGRPYKSEHDCFRIFDNKDFSAPFASGSANYEAMIIIPCSMGTLARIAAGISDTLITRAADVMLKERKKLVLVTRETPLNTIQIENMLKISLAGGIICPANPSFYSKPESIDELIMTVVDRAIKLAGFVLKDMYEWGD